MQCAKCDIAVKDIEAIKCTACQSHYHYVCVALTEEELKRMLPMNKAKWKCPTCKKPNNKPPVKDMDSLVTYMDSKFGEQQKAFQLVIQTELNSIQTGIANLETKIEGQLFDLNSSITQCVTRVSSVETDVSRLGKSFDELRVENEGLKKDVTALKSKSARLEQQARSCNIEIQNLPESKKENLENIVTQLGTVIGVPIDLARVRAVHRVAHNSASATAGRPRAIVVQFTTRRLRDDVLAAARARSGLQTDCLPELKGSPPQPIYLTQHLTLDNKILFSKARALKNKGYKWVWAKDGSIMVRKGDSTPIIHIRSEADIAKLQNVT